MCVSRERFFEYIENISQEPNIDVSLLCGGCADFALLGDVVNAAKHKLLRKGKPQIASADSIRELVVNTQFQDEQGEYSVASKSIDMALKDGTSRELFDVLTNVVNMWIDFLQAAGISGKATKFPHEDRNRIIGRENGSCNDARTGRPAGIQIAEI